MLMMVDHYLNSEEREETSPEISCVQLVSVMSGKFSIFK